VAVKEAERGLLKFALYCFLMLRWLASVRIKISCPGRKAISLEQLFRGQQISSSDLAERLVTNISPSSRAYR
jgi:hypothetical protein